MRKHSFFLAIVFTTLMVIVGSIFIFAPDVFLGNISSSSTQDRLNATYQQLISKSTYETSVEEFEIEIVENYINDEYRYVVTIFEPTKDLHNLQVLVIPYSEKTSTTESLPNFGKPLKESTFAQPCTTTLGKPWIA